MKKRMLTLVAVFVICTLAGVALGVKVEHFTSGNFYIPTRSECSTRNMSYDLRGDVPIPRKKLGIMDSEIGPMYPGSVCSPRRLV